MGSGQPSAANPGVANTHLDNPLRRLTRKHAGYTKSERETGGYSPRNKGRGGSGGMTRTGAEVAAFAITLALTGVGCTIGGALGCYLGGVAGSYLGAKYKCATIQCAPGEVGRDTAMAAIPLPGGAGKGAKLITTTTKKGAQKKAGSSAYDVAVSGGKHAGFLKNYVGRSTPEIERGIVSIEKQIAEHKAKIQNPAAYINDWATLDARQQQALLTSKWPGDIRRQQEQLEILRGILGSRRP